jgi:hypothetical protein
MKSGVQAAQVINCRKPEVLRCERESTRLPVICRAYFKSMKHSENVRKYTAEQGIAEEEALKKGMEEKQRVHRQGS